MVVLDENGKPCRACNTLTDFQQAMGGQGNTSKASFPTLSSLTASGSTSDPTPGSTSSTTPPSPSPMAPLPDESPAHFRNDPPDSWQLGQNTWTFLHSLAAYYPVNPTQVQKDEMTQFITTFSHFYPCKPCARDFEKYLSNNKPQVDDRTSFSLWMCDAHNAVNTKLGKPTFDCKYWQARWRDGWEDFVKSQKK